MTSNSNHFDLLHPFLLTFPSRNMGRCKYSHSWINSTSELKIDLHVGHNTSFFFSHTYSILYIYYNYITMLSLQHQLLFVRSGSMTFVGSSSWIWWKCLRRDSGRSTNQPLGEGFSSMFFSRSYFFPLALSIYLLLIISFLGFLFLFVEVLLISYRLKPTKRDDLVPHFLPDKYRPWTVVKGGGFCGGWGFAALTKTYRAVDACPKRAKNSHGLLASN